MGWPLIMRRLVCVGRFGEWSLWWRVESRSVRSSLQLVAFQVGDGHPTPAVGGRIMVANTSFIAAFWSGNRPITLVRRRSSTNDRSARLVVRTRIRCRTGTRWIATARRGRGEAGHRGREGALVTRDQPVRGGPGGVQGGRIRTA